METPDKWVVLKITNKDEQPIYKVFASWYDAWKMNSGIQAAMENDNVFRFIGYSGSCYDCHKKGYGTTAYGSMVLNGIIKKATEVGTEIEVMEENTNWINLI